MSQPVGCGRPDPWGGRAGADWFVRSAFPGTGSR